MVVFKMKEYIGQIKKKGPLMYFWSRKLTVDALLVQKSHKIFWVGAF